MPYLYYNINYIIKEGEIACDFNLLYVLCLHKGKGNLLLRDDYRGPKLFLDQIFQIFERLPENVITSQMNNDLCNLTSSHVATLVMILVTFLMMLSVILLYEKIFLHVSSVLINVICNIAIQKNIFASQFSFHNIKIFHVMNKYVK